MIADTAAALEAHRAHRPTAKRAFINGATSAVADVVQIRFILVICQADARGAAIPELASAGFTGFDLVVFRFWVPRLAAVGDKLVALLAFEAVVPFDPAMTYNLANMAGALPIA